MKDIFTSGIAADQTCLVSNKLNAFDLYSKMKVLNLMNIIKV